LALILGQARCFQYLQFQIEIRQDIYHASITSKHILMPGSPTMSSTEIGSHRPLNERLIAVARRYWDLGFTSFGGPGVHVIILRQRFVESLKWIDERTFLDLFALGNALPGPGSTQLAFSIAVVTNGVLPGLFAFLLWSLPGAIGMVAIGIGISRIPDQLPGPVLALFTGLNAAAVGLIALAAFQLGGAAGTDRITVALVWLSASFGICYHAPWMYPVLIAAGGLTTLLWDFRRNMWKAITRGRKEREDGNGNQAEIDQGIELDTIAIQRDTEARQEISTTRMESSSKTDDTPIPYPSPAASPVPTRRRLPVVDVDQSTSQINTSTPTSITQIESGPSVQSPEQTNKLAVVSVRVAICLISGFVLLLTVPLATRAGLQSAGKSVPRALDVSPRHSFVMVLMFSSSVISSLLGLSSLEVDLLLSLSYGITSWCQVRLITSAKWARSKLIDRMGQLTRFPPCLCYPVCPSSPLT
jgi:chromate transport protein ChrA